MYRNQVRFRSTDSLLFISFYADRIRERNLVISRLFPDTQASSWNYGFLLSQISVLTKLGLLAQVGATGTTIELNQLVYRCTAKRTNILNIAKNINFDISPYIYVVSSFKVWWDQNTSYLNKQIRGSFRITILLDVNP